MKNANNYNSIVEMQSQSEGQNNATASGSSIQKPLEQARDMDSDSNNDLYDANGILGDKAEKYIRDSANIEDLPGDDDDFDEEDDESIELDEEIEIESEEINDNDIEPDDDLDEEFDSEDEEDDDIL